MLKTLFTHKWKIIITALILFIAVPILNPFSTNDAGNRQVVQTFSGDLYVRFEPGFYWAGILSKVTTWPNNVSVQISQEKNKSEDSDLWIEGSMKDGTFSEGDNAYLEHTVKWDLPGNAEQMLDIHRTYNNIQNLMTTTLLSYQKKIASFSTQRLSSEAHYSGGKSQLDDYFADQLENGQVFLNTETKTRTLADSSTQTYIRVTPKEDKNGNILRKESELLDLGIKATYTSMDNVHYDKRIYEKLKAKIDAAADEATAKQELITAQQVAKTAAAEGEKLIAQTRATEEADKIKSVIQAEKEALVAGENLKKAKLDAQSELVQKKAAAEGDRLKVLAGLTPLERAKIDKETAIGVAAELAKVKFPESMIIVGGDGKSSGSVNPFDAVGLQSFHELSKKMSTKK